MPDKPMVMVTVDGGIAYANVVRGEVDIVQWDWDVIDSTSEPNEIRGYIEQALLLPDGWPEKTAILANMKEALDKLLAAKDEERADAEAAVQFTRRQRAAALLSDAEINGILDAHSDG